MKEKFRALLAASQADGSFTKLVFSKSTDPQVLRSVVTLFAAADGTPHAQMETFQTDGKALHKNVLATDMVGLVMPLLGTSFKQANLFTTAGEASYLSSKKGKETVLSRIRGTGERAALQAHDHAKKTVLREGRHYPFLERLGVMDGEGNVFDKKRSKLRQINSFLSEIENILPHLPKDGVLTVCDLCCGKSYLTFAAYWYFTQVQHRAVSFYGVDRKPDVIADCQKIACDLGYKDLSFLCADITTYTPPTPPHLVVSLHACDIATDIVLASAVRWQARVILSAPCCHHEMMGQIDAPALAFLTDHSMLKQKLCDAATDGLRALRLEAEGYGVTIREFIDPEETPKNLLLRCVRGGVRPEARKAKLEAYQTACKLLGVKPYLAGLLG